ncbi:MAG: HPP family protein [Cytophagales bacterium CG18_big_fil_WC_8_21_14_2_50_42_9]|nr:MAG: HPP family protein [Cytophagales bacterium CG18_big_fil_WC_8_21_14_2_50_42_9]
MHKEPERLNAEPGKAHPTRQPLNWKGELLLALLPTLTVLAVLALMEVLSHQRVLFASLASSAFLIYLDPHYRANRVRTLILSQAAAALVGYGAGELVGPGYWAAGSAMVVVIVLMVLFDMVHPPAVSTTLGFAFHTGPESNLGLFGLGVGLIVVLVLLQKVAQKLLGHFRQVTKFHR